MLRSLLSVNNKMAKTPHNGVWLINGLALAPNKLSGHNVCPWATRGCIDACVTWFAGRTNAETVRAAMLERTRMYFEEREAFRERLRRELRGLVKRANKAGARPACRLNVASDILWELREPWIFSEFPEVTFYDYTKATPFKRDELPANYHLTYSISERTKLEDVLDAFQLGRNVCVVFDADYRPSVDLFGELPKQVQFVSLRNSERMHFPALCVDGDRHDLRIPALDGLGKVVALRGKSGKRRVADAVVRGFVKGIATHKRRSWSVKKLGSFTAEVALA